MVKIISVNPQVEKLKKEITFTNFKQSFSSLDSFSKLMGVTFLLLLVLTPILEYNNILYVFSPQAAPLLQITQPVDQTIVLKNSQIALTAKADDPSIKSMVFTVEGIKACTVYSYPYICLWNVPNLSHQEFVIEAKAYDANGRLITNSIVTVKSGN